MREYIVLKIPKDIVDISDDKERFIHIDNKYIRFFEDRNLLYKKDISTLLEICLHIPTFIENTIKKSQDPGPIICHKVDNIGTTFELGIDFGYFYISISRGDTSIFEADFVRPNFN